MKLAPLSALLLLLVLAPAALAQQAQGDIFLPTPETYEFRSSDIVGATVFATQADVSGMTVDTPPQDWESVGNVGDLIIGRDGMLRGVLLDIGGFLGIGVRTVLVSMDAIQFIERTDQPGVYLVVNTTREQLENAPEYQVGFQSDPAAQPGGAPAAGQPGAAAPPDDQVRVGAAEPAEGFLRADLTTLTAEDLRNAAVYDRFNERVAGITDVLLSADGSGVQGVLIDVGGFLGIGARTVAVGMDQIEIHRDAAGTETRVYLAMTQQELENLPEHQR